MKAEFGKFMHTLKKGDNISLVLTGIIVDGTFEELADDCVVLTDATSPSMKKGHYNLKIPFESIYAWGKKETKEKKKKKNEG